MSMLVKLFSSYPLGRVKAIWGEGREGLAFKSLICSKYKLMYYIGEEIARYANKV
jgi:hypothetical protein